jgi:hypothetical protein
MTEKQLRRDAHRSTAELKAALRGYLTAQNQVANPLVWTKTADAILESVARLCSELRLTTLAHREPSRNPGTIRHGLWTRQGSPESRVNRGACIIPRCGTHTNSSRSGQ